jgi:3-oxoacyl-[acyl-carrier-protein] synthase-3
VNIKALEYYLPKNSLTNDQISLETPEWSVDKIASKTGIFSRPVAEEEKLSSDLALCAAEKIFESGNIEKKDIDFLLFCTQTPDYFLPTTACILQDQLGLSTSIGALDYNLGCSGYIYGLSLAKSLIVSEIARNVLLLTGETYSKIIHPKDKSCRTLFGDGASATIVSSESGITGIGNFCFGTDGKGAANLILKNGAFRHRILDGTDVFDKDNDYMRNDNCLYMNGNEIFNFTCKVIPGLVEKTLKKHELEIGDIDLFVFHQANKYMLNYIKKIAKIPEEKFYINLTNTGNTVSATIPIALKKAIEEGKVKQCNKVLIAGFGVGYSYGATILQF